MLGGGVVLKIGICQLIHVSEWDRRVNWSISGINKNIAGKN